MTIFMGIDDEIIFNRLFDKLDGFQESISALCERLTKMETNYENHIKGKEDNDAKKTKNIYLLIAGIGSVLTILQIYSILSGL